MSTVNQHGQRFKAAVIEQRHAHHDDDAQNDEQCLLLQIGLGVLTLGQQGAACGGVDHDHADTCHKDGCHAQHEVEGGAACAGQQAVLAIMVITGLQRTEYRP